MTPQELKNSILQLAIQGRLVEQRPEEGTAEELYRQIQREKAALVKAGKIKKEKPLPEITEEEVPFEIPEGWKWVRLNSIALKITDGTHHSPPNYERGEYMYVTAKNIKESGVQLSNITYVTKDVHEEIYSRCNPELNDILLIKDGATTGIVTVNNIDKPVSMLSSVALIKAPKVFCPWYIVYVMRSQLFYKGIRAQMKGTGITRITLKQIEPLVIPLPPLAEQKRIVAKIEKLLPYIDRYDKAWSRLEDFNKRFPTDMQKSILQLAIQGKLVPQRPEEGTGEELYTKICKELCPLIQAKRFKEKKSATILDNEIPYDIPSSWKWVRIGDILTIESGKNLTSAQMINGPIPVYGGNGITGYHNESIIHEETIVIGRVGFYCGSVHVTEKEAWITDNAFITTYPKESIDRAFLVYMLRHMNLGKDNNATAQPVVSGKKIYPLLFPLPPLAEQKRIVAKLEELLPLCERLK